VALAARRRLISPASWRFLALPQLRNNNDLDPPRTGSLHDLISSESCPAPLRPAIEVSWQVRRIFQTAAWLLLLAIAVLTLAPPWYRPVTHIHHTLEHLAIFVATGLAFGLGYSAPYLYRLIPLIGFTAAVEIAQLWVPGRHARLSDFLINVLGVSIGLAWVSAQDRFFDQWAKATTRRLDAGGRES
jgi:VanZ family protein